ncbi:alpha/beta fold hydrolase [Bdellovibrio sp. KM01]|uniref:alpha/beta fold hydrolase n=1 Tax=Bdellovibrio sp. KM01 TaxID=2748865 RepID=UPI0015E9957E|nr:alpha/beta hydrolase [Bdellovibrio sp. KM01]QLY26770.1 alpha/beta hydrolase [Bdellovibrio sp. KM01]
MNKNQSTPLVCLHGFLCDPRLWQDVMAIHSFAGPVHLIDFKFCKTLEDMLGQIEKLADSRFHLVGFSMGGYIAELFATRFPERIESLTLIAANVGALSQRDITTRMKMAEMLLNVQYKGMSEKEVAKFIHPESAKNLHVVEAIIEMSRAYTSEMYVNQMRATLHREDLTEALDALEFPISIIAGREDRVVSYDSLKTFHEAISRSDFQVIEESGHYLPLEKPDDVSRAILRVISR